MHIRTPKPIASISKPPPLLGASVSNKISQQRHDGYTKLQKKIFVVDHVMILICYSKRCSLVVELMSDSHFLDKRLFYVIRDGLSLLLAKETCNDVQNSTSTFLLMFDESMTKQKRKQLDMLRHFSKTTNLVETRYLLPFLWKRFNRFCCLRLPGLAK